MLYPGSMKLGVFIERDGVLNVVRVERQHHETGWPCLQVLFHPFCRINAAFRCLRQARSRALETPVTAGDNRLQPLGLSPVDTGQGTKWENRTQEGRPRRPRRVSRFMNALSGSIRMMFSHYSKRRTRLRTSATMNFAICYSPFAFCHLPFAICHSPFAIHYSLFAICYFGPRGSVRLTVKSGQVRTGNLEKGTLPGNQGLCHYATCVPQLA